jgi:broad specificity phosphatase PhoE
LHSDLYYDDARYITHILASPLTRALDTALLAFEDVTTRGVKVLAIPELQSLSDGPNGLGMNIEELEKKYGAAEGIEPSDDTHEPNEALAETTHTNDALKGRVSFEYMCKDWNWEGIKKGGRFSRDYCAWRVDHMKGFLRALAAGRGHTEIVVVSHSSFLEKVLNGKHFSFLYDLPADLIGYNQHDHKTCSGTTNSTSSPTSSMNMVL